MTALGSPPVSWRTQWFPFPETVNEVAARLVAGAVLIQAALYTVTGWWPLLASLVIGFWLRVGWGPRFSPLARLVTQVVIPGLGLPNRPTAGSPKRFAQGIGATFTTVAVVAVLLGQPIVAAGLTGAIVIAAGLESLAGFCLGCWAYGQLIRLGVLHPSVCLDCSDISSRLDLALRGDLATQSET